MSRAICLGVAVTLTAACGSGSSSTEAPKGPAPAQAMTLGTVAWNTANVDVGQVQAVTEQDKTLAIFSTKGAILMTSGSVVGSDASVTAWRSAGVIPAADGTGPWIVGIDGAGKLWHAQSSGTLEDVSDRFGLLDAKIQLVSSGKAGLEGPPTGFLLESGAAMSDGTTVTRWDGPLTAIAAGGGHVVVASDGAIRVFDAKGQETDLALPDAAFVAYDDAGDLLAATHHALYAVESGGLRLLYDAQGRTIHTLVSAGAAVWLSVDSDLAVYRGGQVSITSGGTFPPDVRLFGSPSGDVWTLAAGQLQRFSAQAAASSDEAAWTSTVQPIYAAVCSNCHSPPGTAGKDTANVDLSTYAAWNARRAKVYLRVISEAGSPGAMPPPSSGYTLTDAQRAAIEAWSKPQ